LRDKQPRKRESSQPGVRSIGIENAAVPAGFPPLRHQHIDPGIARQVRFGKRGHRREQQATGGLERG